MAWSVPATFEGDFRLQMILQDGADKEWTICTHGIVARSSHEGEEGRHHVGHVRQPFTEALAAEFLNGLESMVGFYEPADGGLRQDILRYYGRYINSYSGKDNESLYVMSFISSIGYQDSHNMICSVVFIKDLLSFPSIYWIPP